jgi:flagellar hook assembly protein FlgD
MRILTILALLFLVSICHAQSDSMIVVLTNGAVKSYPVPSIQQLTFAGTATSVRELQLMQQALASFTLHHNYPNPFNPSTTISYEIPRSGLVEISLHDIQGNLVRLLHSSVEPAGFHAKAWDGRNTGGIPVSSGTYFCRVLFDGNLLTTKLTLIK